MNKIKPVHNKPKNTYRHYIEHGIFLKGKLVQGQRYTTTGDYYTDEKDWQTVLRTEKPSEEDTYYQG